MIGPSTIQTVTLADRADSIGPASLTHSAASPELRSFRCRWRPRMIPRHRLLFLAQSQVPPRPLTVQTLSLFFELSLGLSARKETPGSGWFLRMNPSSGNLHPTEGYAILPCLEGVSTGAGVYHYAPLEHAFEQRAHWPAAIDTDPQGFHVGLTSIIWREAWKYGERAFRYCQHDVGHALAALRYSAAALGWKARLRPEWTDAALASLLGLDRAEDFGQAEREMPELLVQITTGAHPHTDVTPPVSGAIVLAGAR